jgi:hypothetical protein
MSNNNPPTTNTMLGWVLVGTLVMWGVLAFVAGWARDPRDHMSVADFNQAGVWGTTILGLAATVAGFFGLAKSQGLRSAEAQGGLFSILAGTTLLGVGEWVPAAGLAALAAGIAIDRISQTLKAAPTTGP